MCSPFQAAGVFSQLPEGAPLKLPDHWWPHMRLSYTANIEAGFAKSQNLQFIFKSDQLAQKAIFFVIVQYKKVVQDK